jgi:hypothetical protein
MSESSWVLYGILICWGIDSFFLDFIIVLLGKSEKLRGWFSIRGFYFDYDFQEEYNRVIDDL